MSPAVVALGTFEGLKGCPLRTRAYSFSPVLAEENIGYPEAVALGR